MRFLVALFSVVVGVGFVAPAQATGGFVCRTAGVAPITVSLGFGQVPGSPLILTQLIDAGRTVPVSAAQW